MENLERDGNTRPPDLPLEKPICRSGSNIRAGYGATECFQIRKEYVKAVYCHSAYLIYMHHEKRWLEEAQAGIKIAGRNISNLKYAGDTTLMAESEEELKSLWMKVKE